MLTFIEAVTRVFNHQCPWLWLPLVEGRSWQLGWRLRMHSSRSMLLPIIKTIEDLQLLSDAPAHRSFVCWLPPITCYHCELTWIGFLDRILVSIFLTFIDGLRRERYRGSLHFIAKLTLSLDESSKSEKECPDLLSILSIPLFSDLSLNLPL